MSVGRFRRIFKRSLCANCRNRSRRPSRPPPRLLGNFARREQGCLGRVDDAFAAGDGSSPHVRRTPGTGAGREDPRRFIPACAGNTLGIVSAPRGLPVHPRMRGEHGTCATRWSCSSGSSPHARGTQTRQSTGQALYSGSSPHARGTRGRQRGQQPSMRFIPACAGNTNSGCRRIRPRSVHPRMRGEHAMRFDGANVRIGSSPHARGTQVGHHSAVCARRFIPACAGNTALPRPGLARPSVHPRMRGEHQRAWHVLIAATGSSPHARGTQQPAAGSVH